MVLAHYKRSGFTLIEILIVIGLIAILASIVIVAVNPLRQFAQGRNAQRHADVNATLNAVYQYAVDNGGNLPATITTIATEICKTGSTSCTDLVDLSVLTAGEKYLVSIPVDPQGGILLTNGAGYTVVKTAGGRVTVAAPKAELQVTISVTR